MDRKRGAGGVDQKVGTSFRSDRKVGKGQALGEEQESVCVGGGTNLQN